MLEQACKPSRLAGPPCTNNALRTGVPTRLPSELRTLHTHKCTAHGPTHLHWCIHPNQLGELRGVLLPPI